MPSFAGPADGQLHCVDYGPAWPARRSTPHGWDPALMWAGRRTQATACSIITHAEQLAADLGEFMAAPAAPGREVGE